MKNILAVLVILVLGVVGFYALNTYIYEEKQADFVVGETVSKSGKVLSVDTTQIAFDGPYLLTLESEDGELNTIALPSMGLPLCEAYTAKKIGDINLIKAGEMIDVRGEVGEDGSIVPCNSSDHYLTTTPIVVDDFEGEADPSKMTLGMKTWRWIRSEYNDGRVVTPNMADKFNLTFNTDGTFGASTDCNGIGGNYTAKDGEISFSQMISTLMYCEGSQESEFRDSLANSTSYHFTSKGELILDLKFDSGSVIFR